ncbi:uncharacterized protein LOC132750348 [Ruditapes philippinarum]|uniref:uncharacterized protein LOC132750348 n=1 Tax=Ruditapes philippinarum TaxID=129788 RepID=UPI00295AA8BB|nr:uncharacterized protein LOC132750348 [Ruditapes philippinarum]
MDARIILLTVMCTVKCTSGQGQLGLHTQSENGFNDLFSAIRPVTLHVSSNDGKNQVTIKYKLKVSTVSFWNIETTDASDLTYSLGKLSSDGEMNVSSIELNARTDESELNFHISSSIGEVVLGLNYTALKEQVVEIEIPDIGVRPMVPPVYKPMASESACTEQFIYVKFERDDDGINLRYGRDVEFIFVDPYLYEGLLLKEGDYDYDHFIQKTKHYYGMEIELKSEYIQNGSEIQAKYESYKHFGDEINKYVKQVSKTVYSVIKPPVPVEYVMFHNELGMFQEAKQTIDIPRELVNWAVTCAAFGVPKAKIEISDPSGNIMSAIEVTPGNGMTTHVFAPLTNIARDKMAGDYKCVARSGLAVIEQTVTLKATSTP